MPNVALQMTQASPLSLERAGYNTNVGYGAFERTASSNAHRARMEQLAEERKMLQAARDRLENANRQKGLGTVMAAGGALGLGALGLPVNLALAGGNALGSISGETPSAGVLNLVGGGMEYARNHAAETRIAEASKNNDYGWGGGSVLSSRQPY